MSNLYIQCRLSKGKEKQVAWVQKHLAIEGQHVELKDEDGIWLVDTAYSNVVLPWEEINDRGQNYKRTRDASDI